MLCSSLKVQRPPYCPSCLASETQVHINTHTLVTEFITRLKHVLTLGTYMRSHPSVQQLIQDLFLAFGICRLQIIATS